MAIFHLVTKNISRAKGQNAVAKGAYNARDRLTDERTGEAKDYSQKEGLMFSGIFAPKNAPDWAHDRAQLWNHAEAAETRKNSRTAREIEIALPHELTEQQREYLVKDFVREQFVRRGMVADVNIHAPHQDGDGRNYHAHILLTTREISPEGFTEKNRDWNTTETLEKWREGWERTANRYLERHGHEARIDRRTLEAQGIDREPSQHIGPQITAMQRRGIHADRYAELSAGENHNKELAQARAELAATSRDITREQARVSEPEKNLSPTFEKTRHDDPRAAIITHSAELVKTRQEQERQQLQAKQTEERAALAEQIKNKIDMRRRLDGMAQEERDKRRAEMAGHGNAGLFDRAGLESQTCDAMRYKDFLNRQAAQKVQNQERQKKRDEARQRYEQKAQKKQEERQQSQRDGVTVRQYQERQRAGVSDPERDQTAARLLSPQEQREAAQVSASVAAQREQQQRSAQEQQQKSAASSGGTQAGTGNKEMTDKARERQERVERYLKQMGESERQQMERGGGRERTRER